MLNTIARSAGLPTGVLGLVAGGGQRGATTVLDAEVERAAELLRAFYKQDVVIRFNSDRMSGGTWLKTHDVDGFGRNSDLGITVALFVVEDMRKLYDRFQDPDDKFEDRLRRDGIDPANPPESYLSRAIMVKPARLRRSVATNNGVPDAPYLYEGVDNLEAAMARLAVVGLKHPRKPT